MTIFAVSPLTIVEYDTNIIHSMLSCDKESILRAFRGYFKRYIISYNGIIPLAKESSIKRIYLPNFDTSNLHGVIYLPSKRSKCNIKVLVNRLCRRNVFKTDIFNIFSSIDGSPDYVVIYQK